MGLINFLILLLLLLLIAFFLIGFLKVWILINGS